MTLMLLFYGGYDDTADLPVQTLTYDNVVREYYVSYPENTDS